MTDTERSLRRQIADHYETYRHHSDAARGLLDDGEDREDRAAAAIHAALAQGAAAMANTLALLLTRDAQTS